MYCEFLNLNTNSQKQEFNINKTRIQKNTNSKKKGIQLKKEFNTYLLRIHFAQKTKIHNTYSEFNYDETTNIKNSKHIKEFKKILFAYN